MASSFNSPADAMMSLNGYSEGVPKQDAAISAFIKQNAGLNVDPATTAWCAAFLNAALGASGQQGTGKLNAQSFLNWGSSVDAPQPGDVVVFSRGKPGSGLGHVGIFMGANADGTIKVLSGNHLNSVGVDSFKTGNVLGYRRGDPSTATAALSGGPTDPVSAYASQKVYSGDAYKVRSGDTLTRIARVTGVPVNSLASINKIADPNKIYAGQSLKTKSPAVSAINAATSPPMPLPRSRPPQGADSLGAQAGSRAPGAMANTTTLGWDPQYGHTIAGETIRGSLPAADYARARLTAANVPPIPSSFGLPLIPKPAPITSPTVNEAMREQMQARAVPPSLPTAPVPMPGRPGALFAASAGPVAGFAGPIPMPGRPAALNAAPPAPVQAQPPQLPTQRPSAPVAPPAAQQVRIASGKMVAPGTYPSSDGHHTFTVNSDGSITHNQNFGEIPGLLDPLREASAPTLAGSIIRGMAPAAASDAVSSFAPAAVSGAKNTALGAASGLGGMVQNIPGAGPAGDAIGNILGIFGSVANVKAPQIQPWWQQAFRSANPSAGPTPRSAFSLFRPSLPSGGGLARIIQAPQPMNRPAVFSMPQQQAPQHQTYQQAQNDLRDSGMIDQFGMIRM